MKRGAENNPVGGCDFPEEKAKRKVPITYTGRKMSPSTNMATKRLPAVASWIAEVVPDRRSRICSSLQTASYGFPASSTTQSVQYALLQRAQRTSPVETSG